jgi:hypothetical protein
MSFYIEKEMEKKPPTYQLTVTNRGAGSRLKQDTLFYPFYEVKGITDIKKLTSLLLELKTEDSMTLEKFYTQDLPSLTPSKEVNTFGHLVVGQSKGTCELSSPQQFSHLLAYKIEQGILAKNMAIEKLQLIKDMIDQLSTAELIKILVKDVLEKGVSDKQDDARKLLASLEIEDSTNMIGLIKTHSSEQAIPLLVQYITAHLEAKSQQEVTKLLKKALLDVPFSYLLYKGFGFSTPHLRRIVKKNMLAISNQADTVKPGLTPHQEITAKQTGSSILNTVFLISSVAFSILILFIANAFRNTGSDRKKDR